MSRVNLTEMADILPSIAITTESSHYYFYGCLMSVFFLLLLLIFLWHYRQHPLRQLKRQLIAKQISTREASHHLSKIIPLLSHKNKIQLEQQLKQMRFQRQSPDITILLSIIEQYQHGQ